MQDTQNQLESVKLLQVSAENQSQQFKNQLIEAKLKIANMMNIA